MENEGILDSTDEVSFVYTTSICQGFKGWLRNSEVSETTMDYRYKEDKHLSNSGREEFLTVLKMVQFIQDIFAGNDGSEINEDTPSFQRHLIYSHFHEVFILFCVCKLDPTRN